MRPDESGALMPPVMHAKIGDEITHDQVDAMTLGNRLS